MNVNKININQSEYPYYIASDIYDVTAHNNGATFASLSALLSSENLSTLIPTSVRCGGMSIRFIQSSDNRYVQYRLTASIWSNDIHDWTSEDPYFIDKIMQEVNKAIDEHTPIEIHGDVTNAPDEEDLTSVNVGGTDVLKFKDKAYNPLTYSGMGRKILRKNIVDGVNTLTQSMMQDTNTIYVIQYDFTLGEDITVHDNCILQFDGGSITANGNNDTIIGNNTVLLGCKNCISLSIILAGTWVDTPVESNWFSIIGDCTLNNDLTYASGTNNYQGFVNLFKFRNITINNGTYYVLYTATISVLSGTVVNGNNATIKAVYVTQREFIKVEKADNIIIENLVLIGAKLDKSDKGQWAAGISVYNGKNIRLSNIISKYFRGDGFCIGNWVEYPEIWPENVIIENCISTNNNRQGLSITSGKNISIRNCTFAYTSGTAPKSGIDIEPNSSSEIIENIEIINCNFLYNDGNGIQILGRADSNNRSNVRNIIIKGCIFKNNSFTIRICEKLDFSDNYLNRGAVYLAENIQYDINIHNNILDGLNYDTKVSSYSTALFIGCNNTDTKDKISVKDNIIKYYNEYGIHVTEGLINNFRLENNIVDHTKHNIVIRNGTNVFYSNNRITNQNKDYNGNAYDSFSWRYYKKDDAATRIDLDSGLTGENIDGNIPTGTMKFTNGAPQWYNGSAWVNATGTPV